MYLRRNFFLSLIFALCLLAQLGCNKKSNTVVLKSEVASIASQNEPQHSNAQEQSRYPELEFFDERLGDAKDSTPLEYKGFQIIRKTKPVRLEETTKATELSYAQILHKGQVLMMLEGVEHPLGNETRFKLLPFLSPDTQQLLVQQDAWRSSRQWIVSLTSKPMLLFDSRDYLLEGFGAIDLDRDGQFELVGAQKYWHFEFSNGMTFSSADSPVLSIVFAYNKKTRKYEPANPQFKSYLLEMVADAKSQLENKQGNDPQSLFDDMSDVMLVTMTLALVGEVETAWIFFDRYCPTQKPIEKEQVKTRIKFAIRENTAYKKLKQNHQL